MLLPQWASDDETMSADAVLDAARGEHRWHRDRSEAAEEKANRLGQTCIALLTVALALAAYQATQFGAIGGGWWYLLSAPDVLAIAFIAIAGIGALEVDRVGLYRFVQVRELVTEANRAAALSRLELRAAVLAAWTANHKYDLLIQARAWLSRGLVSLVIAALASVSILAAATQNTASHEGITQHRAASGIRSP